MIDRLQHAKKLCVGKRVIDIGGSRMKPGDSSPFDNAYREIQQCAKEYTIVDKSPTADIVVDLNSPHAVYGAVMPPCDVVLCMETLEHLRNPGIVCDKISLLVAAGAIAYITLPRSSMMYRYLEANGLGKFWGRCLHLYAFHRHHLSVFLSNNFYGLRMDVHGCIGQYTRAWPLMLLLTGFKGLSWGVEIQK